MPTQPYRPASGTEGAVLHDTYCSRCVRDQEGSCPILRATFAFSLCDDRYPPEWIQDEGVLWRDRNPRCTAFEMIGGGDCIPDVRQMEMFA